MPSLYPKFYLFGTLTTIDTMEKTVNNLRYDKAVARVTPEEFARLNGPFFVKNVYAWDTDADGNKVKTDTIVNRFCIRLKGPMNADGTVPPASQGDQIAYVSTSLEGKNINPDEVEFAAFFDEKGQLQWILQKKGAGFTEEAAMVFGV